jgi:hypothetical protein
MLWRHAHALHVHVVYFPLPTPIYSIFGGRYDRTDQDVYVCLLTAMYVLTMYVLCVSTASFRAPTRRTSRLRASVGACHDPSAPQGSGGRSRSGCFRRHLASTRGCRAGQDLPPRRRVTTTRSAPPCQPWPRGTMSGRPRRYRYRLGIRWNAAVAARLQVEWH